MADLIGQHLGSYCLIRLLGRGSFGEVYLGKHLRLTMQAAVKVQRLHLADEDIEAFHAEAQTIASLVHPHIVRVLDFDVKDGLPFMVMDYAPNGSLRQRHPRGTQLPLLLVVSYVKQVAAALQYVHDQHLIHRDIKPENLLLSSQDNLLLADFGVALFLRQSHSPYSTHDLAQQVAGTPLYLAPEQLQGHPHLQSDQYALGVVIYEWLTGRPPFQGAPIEIAMHHLSMPPPPFRHVLPDFSPAVEEVVLRALAKEPELRFASVQDFATALQSAAQTGMSLHSIPLYVSGPAADSPRPSDTVPVAPVQEPPFSEPVITPSSVSSRGREERDLSKPEPMWRMPAFLTPFIGREQEVASICAMLQQAEVHLLTLVGMGGIGKTRLCIEVATQLHAHFADGVCFVALAPISNPDLAVPTIADALGIKEMGEQSLREQVEAELRQKHLLLLLDNFEQVVAAAPTVEALLLACPHLTVLVTSRAVLHLQAEHLFPVPPLTLPDLTQLPEYDVLVQSAAVALFQQRAQAVLPTFCITLANAPTIAEICVRLDGLPLAIELAAARIRLLPPQALLSRLMSRLQVLTGGARTLPTRQQTLRNTLQWSYDLLDTEEQRLFRHLAIFVGGCSLEAVEALCRGVGDQTTDVLNVMASLLDKSFIQQVEQTGNEPRFMMLETLREFGLEALAATGEMEATRQAHAAYYMALAEEAEPTWEGPQQAVWSERLEQEHDNLRAAMQWSLERGEVGHGMEIALRLGGALRRFWQMRGYLSEGRAFLEQVLARSEGVVASVRVKALIAMGHLAIIRGDYKRVETACEESLALCQQLGERADRARTLYLLGWFSWMKGDLVAARSLLEETVALFTQVGDKIGIAWSLMHLAITVSRQGDYIKGRALFEENLARQRELGNKRGIAFSLCMFAQLLIDCQQDLVTVRSMPEEGLTLFREISDKWGVATAFMLLGQVALQQGDVTTARSFAEESVRLCKEVGQRWDTGRSTAIFASQSVAILAEVADAQHDQAAARALYQESLEIAREVGDKVLIALGLESLAGVVAAQGEPVWATRLWGAAAALRNTIGAPIPPVERAGYERATAAVRTHLGEKAFAEAWAQGRTMTPEQVLVAQGPETTHQQIPVGSASAPPAKVSGYPAGLTRKHLHPKVFRDGPAKASGYPAGLTSREVEVLSLVAAGLTDVQIAEQLVISPRTVSTHLTSIYNKLGISSRSAATRFAVEHQLV